MGHPSSRAAFAAEYAAHSPGSQNITFLVLVCIDDKISRVVVKKGFCCSDLAIYCSQ